MRWLRYAVLTLGLIAIVYGTLYFIAVQTQPLPLRLAHLDDSDLAVEGFEEVPQPAPAEPGTETEDGLTVEGSFLVALELLQEGSNSFLGLFKRVEEDLLETAGEYLDHVIEDSEPQSFLYFEALYWRAQTHLALIEPDLAHPLLEELAASESRRSNKAAHQMQSLE